MLALKRHYSLATADQLDWILAPTTKLLALLTPVRPVYESGVGYADYTHGMIIAPACAGVNFMIMVFGLGAFCGLAKLRRLVEMGIWVSITLAAAFASTIIINTMRIYVSMVLYKADIYGGWISIERVHRLAGIGLYASALWLLFISFQLVLGAWTRPKALQSSGLPVWLPLCWYLAGTAGAPLANLLFKQGAPMLVEHVLTVLITAMFVFGAGILVRRLLINTFTTPSLPHRTSCDR
jgi:exosortase K